MGWPVEWWRGFVYFSPHLRKGLSRVDLILVFMATSALCYPLNLLDANSSDAGPPLITLAPPPVQIPPTSQSAPHQFQSEYSLVNSELNTTSLEQSVSSNNNPNLPTQKSHLLYNARCSPSSSPFSSSPFSSSPSWVLLELLTSPSIPL